MFGVFKIYLYLCCVEIKINLEYHETTSRQIFFRTASQALGNMDVGPSNRNRIIRNLCKGRLQLRGRIKRGLSSQRLGRTEKHYPQILTITPNKYNDEKKRFTKHYAAGLGTVPHHGKIICRMPFPFLGYFPPYTANAIQCSTILL
mgnify:CR=1 FL=1